MADNQSIVAGFFATPEQYQQNQLQQLYANQLAQAQLSPIQQASFDIGAGAQRLGNAVGGLMGVEDPQMKVLSIRNQVMKNIDYTDPESVKSSIQALMSAGDTQGAHELYKETLKNSLTQSQITKNLREGKAAQTKLQEVGVAEGTREPVYSYLVPDGQGGVTAQQVVFKMVNGKQEMVPYGGGVDRTTSKTNMNVKLPEGESEFVKRLGTLDAERVNAGLTLREGAIQQLEIADRLAKASPQALSGEFANTRAGLVNMLDSMGLTSSKDKQKLLQTQTLTADSSRLVLAALNNKLGGGVSNQDAQRIEAIFPKLDNSPEARKELIDIVVRSANKTINEVNNMETYARKNRGLSGYKPTIPLVGTQQPSTPYSSLSDAELAARIKRAQAQQRQ